MIDDLRNSSLSALAANQLAVDRVQEIPWGPLVSLSENHEEMPLLPPDLLPEALRSWCVDVASRACIPLEFVAVPALVGIGAVVGRSIGIKPERFDDWIVVPNLWGAIVSPPGTLKSHAIAEALSPLTPLEAAARLRFKEEDIEAQAQQRVLKGELASMGRSQSNGDCANEKDEVVRLLRELQEAKATEKRYRTSDATQEKLGELLRDNPRGMLLCRDELAGWLAMLDKPERTGERAFFLEAWAGNSSFTCDRIGRGTVFIPALCLSVIGGIQPGRLRAYLAEAMGEGSGADGLLQRFQLFVWPDRRIPWKRPNHGPDNEARRQADQVFRSLDEMKAGDLAPLYDASGREIELPTLRFDDDAQSLFDSWRGELEERLRAPDLEAFPAFVSHLSKYRSLMPSLALLFELIARTIAPKPNESGVGLHAAQQAAAWCEFLEIHAKRAYGGELQPGRDAARHLATQIKKGAIHDGDSVRSIHRAGWTGLSSIDRIRAGLRDLEHLNWVRISKITTGGRPSEIVRLHPDFRGGQL